MSKKNINKTKQKQYQKTLTHTTQPLLDLLRILLQLSVYKNPKQTKINK